MPTKTCDDLGDPLLHFHEPIRIPVEPTGFEHTPILPCLMHLSFYCLHREDRGHIAYGPAFAEAERLGTRALKIDYGPPNLLDIALGHVILARTRLYWDLLSASKSEDVNQRSSIFTALAKLREANALHHFPKALLTAALHAGTLGEQPDEARRYLAEAQQVAERGPMPLYLADVHLHRARLFRDKAELAKARALIEKHGYWRRKEELEDAEAAAKEW
jgi:hypothetical protein